MEEEIRADLERNLDGHLQESKQALRSAEGSSRRRRQRAGQREAEEPPPVFSHASDFWSLGTLLYHFATGAPPPHPPPAVLQRPPLASAELVSLVSWLLEPHPLRRPRCLAAAAHLPLRLQPHLSAARPSTPRRPHYLAAAAFPRPRSRAVP